MNIYLISFCETPHEHDTYSNMHTEIGNIIFSPTWLLIPNM